MSDIIPKDIKKGTKVTLFLISGKEIEGILSGINNACIILDVSNGGHATISRRLIGGCLIHAEEVVPEKSLELVIPSKVEEVVPEKSLELVIPSKVEEVVPEKSLELVIPSKVEEVVPEKSLELVIPSKVEEVVPEKSLEFFEKEKPDGYLSEFNSKGKWGIILDSNGESFFFHINEVKDVDLIRTINNSSFNNIPVVYDVWQRKNKNAARNIYKFRTIEESYNLALDYYSKRDINNALFFIDKVLKLNNNYKNVKELFNYWEKEREEIGNFKFSNPYSIARQYQLVNKNYEKAEYYYREALSKNDNFFNALEDLSKLLVKQDRVTEAVNLIEDSRNKYKEQTFFDGLLIQIYLTTAQYDKAIELLNWQLYISTSIKHKIQLLWNIANCYLNQENYVEAEKNYREIIKINPDNIPVWRNIAFCYSKLKRYDDAEEILNKLLDKYLDYKSEELLEAIINSKRTGSPVQIDQVTIELSLSELSVDLSKFTIFFLDNCDFQGVAPDRIKLGDNNTKKYIGNETDAKRDIEKLIDIAQKLGTKRPRERSNYYLSAARIIHDTLEDSSQFNKYLYRSFASRGDASIIENKSIDSAISWYSESLSLYDGVKILSMDETDAINSLVRYLYSTLGPSYIQLSPKMPSIYDSLEDILKSHPQSEKVFNAISYIIIRSKYASNRLLNRLYDKAQFRAMALDYLNMKGIPNKNLSIKLDEFVNYWMELRRKLLSELRTISFELQYLINIEISSYNVENAIERINRLQTNILFNLDKNRLEQLNNIFKLILDLCKQTRFEDQERLSNQVISLCNGLISDIEDSPTKLSIEEIYPIVKMLRNKIGYRLSELYITSTPQISVRLPFESYAPNNNQEIETQIVVENKIGCSPAESIELIIKEDLDLFKVLNKDIKLEKSLGGGTSVIFKVPLKVTSNAILNKTFSLSLFVKYKIRSGEILESQVNIFSIRLYSGDEFERIDNPYVYAESGIVDDPSMFYGRDELIQNIVSSFQKTRVQGKCIIIFGQKRSGKSSILYHLKCQLIEQDDLIVIDFQNIGSIIDEDSSSPFTHQFLWGILRELKSNIDVFYSLNYPKLNIQFPTDIDYYKHPSPVSLFKDILSSFKKETKSHAEWSNVRIILLIDEFSYIYDQIIKGKISESFMKIWKALLQENYFNAILAGQDVMPKFKQKYPNEFGIVQDERVTYLKKEDAIKLIDEPIRISGTTDDSRYREGAINRILELSAGSPYYIQIICNRLVDYMNEKHEMLVTQADVENVKNELIKGVNALSIDKFDNLINSGDTSPGAISDKDIINVLKIIANNSQNGSCNRIHINCKTTTTLDNILDDLVKRDIIDRERDNYYKLKIGLFNEWLIANEV